MTRKLDYRWNLRQVMASRGMFQTTDLIGPLAERQIRLSPGHVHRLVTTRPKRLSLMVLMALLDILDCPMDLLIEPAASATASGRSAPSTAASSGPLTAAALLPTGSNGASQ